MADQGNVEAGNLQNYKLARPQRQHWEQGEADDEAGKCAQVAGSKYEQTVPSTH